MAGTKKAGLGGGIVVHWSESKKLERLLCVCRCGLDRERKYVFDTARITGRDRSIDQTAEGQKERDVIRKRNCIGKGQRKCITSRLKAQWPKRESAI
jgi:hypothetical protein